MCEELRNKLVVENLPLVRFWVKKINGKFTMDAYQSGVIGLIKAIDRYEGITKGAKLSTYASFYIMKEITNHNVCKNIIRIPTDTYLICKKWNRFKFENSFRDEYVGLENFLKMNGLERSSSRIRDALRALAPKPNILEGIGKNESESSDIEELKKLFKLAVKETYLSKREEKALTLRYEGEGKTLDEVGKELKVTRARARQIILRATNKIKGVLDNKKSLLAIVHENKAK